MINSTQTNASLFNIAEACLPGAGLGGYALAEDIRFVFSHGDGARLQDVEGNEYIDYVGGAGAFILGHSHPMVVRAAQAQVARGMHMFGTLNDMAIKLAERLIDDIPCAEKIAFATTGSEATAYAMRLARAYTKRDKILKFEGAYHGNHDYALVSTFPTTTGNYPHGSADTAGHPEATKSTMLIAPFNDWQAVENIIAENKGEVAAIIVEAVQRIIPAEYEFLKNLRRICDQNDIVLIFDEVVTGFRLSYDSAQGYYDVMPDLATFGKVIGGAGPLSCVAGKADIINLADPTKKGQPDYTYFNGTLHGNPVAAAATLATLDELAKPDIHENLNKLTDEFCGECQKILDNNDVAALALNTGSLWQIMFLDKPPRNHADVLAGDGASMRKLDTQMMKLGHYMLPGVRRFISTAHTNKDLDETLKALDQACRAM